MFRAFILSSGASHKMGYISLFILLIVLSSGFRSEIKRCYNLLKTNVLVLIYFSIFELTISDSKNKDFFYDM